MTSWVECNSTVAGVTCVEGVSRNGCAICVTTGVEPDVSDFATIVERVVRDGHVVSTDDTVVVVVVVGSIETNTNTTVVERVTANNAAFTATKAETDVLLLDSVVQGSVSFVVRNGRVSDR